MIPEEIVKEAELAAIEVFENYGYMVECGRFIEKRNKKTTPTHEYVKEFICEWYDIKPDVVFSKLRNEDILTARQVCQYFLRELCKLPWHDISSMTGGFSRLTAMYSRKKIAQDAETYKYFGSEIARMREHIINNFD
jgi:chromosomal replication initiation ATPase DnaA